MMYSGSSGGNSQSTTPTLQSPAIGETPRLTKKGSVSTDSPTTRNRGLSLVSDLTGGSGPRRRENRRRSSLSASQHHPSRSPNRHARQSSTITSNGAAYALPVAQDIFIEEGPVRRMQVKRSKSENHIVLQDELSTQDIYTILDGSAIVENESSGEDRGDELAKTKAARAQSEHRRRVELKESFEKLRLMLGVPQPRAGKKDLVEQAIVALDYHKRREQELAQEIQYLRQQSG